VVSLEEEESERILYFLSEKQGNIFLRTRTAIDVISEEEERGAGLPKTMENVFRRLNVAMGISYDDEPAM
jgi:hypothetical protein